LAPMFSGGRRVRTAQGDHPCDPEAQEAGLELTLSPDLEAFRAECARFIRERAPGADKRPGTRSPAREDLARYRAWWASLFEAGFLGADWPVELGGRPDYSPVHDYLFDGELGAAQAPTPVGAWRLVATALIQFGSPAQRERYLPRIRTCADFWCQLFSEPDAGSDLASLRLQARRDGDRWILNGQKVWTTHAHIADLGFLLARTDTEVPKHQGITAFIVDMHSPGIEVRPLRELTGSSDFNEVFFTDVAVGLDRVIGQPGQGWEIARTCLARERSESRREDSVIQAVLRLADLAELTASGDPDKSVITQLGRLYARAEISDLLGFAQLEKELSGVADVDDAAIIKVMFTELNLDLQRAALDIEGADGVLVEEDLAAIDRGHWQEGFLWARGFTISAGSNEIMRNIIAERQLGLPKDRP
jgi:alkylation response protein AidB-like acyl-CoA dehydrogenase